MKTKLEMLRNTSGKLVSQEQAIKIASKLQVLFHQYLELYKAKKEKAAEEIKQQVKQTIIRERTMAIQTAQSSHSEEYFKNLYDDWQTKYFRSKSKGK
jgi:hypothetical protein